MSGMSDFFKLQRGFLQDQQELISKQIARLYEFELSMSSGSAVQNAPNHSPLKVVPPKISDAVVVSNTKEDKEAMKARKKEEKEAEYLRKKAEKKELKLAKRKARDPNMPKKPPSAYILFCNEQQTKLKAEQAHDSEEPLNQKEIMTKVGGMWSALPPEKKAIYQKRHDLEVLAHAKKMEAYNKSLAGAEEDSSSEEEEDKQPPVTFAMKKVPEPVSVVSEPAKAKAPEHEPHGVVDKRKKKRHESEESVMQDERHSADAARQEMTPSEQEKKKKKKKTKHPSDSAKE